ncbi:hypothetical protein [Lactobacillus delbrueckii]|uniref:hypothetical protein n=1 Tax=Lactobacillus delbrueckii TaxID=1584 RepID=UPI00138979F0|nr:hypothetical protein [Lactobacillus delbrueckii]MDG9748005.1 hypothetical protein [Lactobacillus delbrueckii subsp. bulgaricus ATCC 11842 = JCM 1002]
MAVAVWAHDADMAMGISPIPMLASWLLQFLEGLAQFFFNHQNVISHEIASLKELAQNVKVDVIAQNADIAVAYSRFSSMLFSPDTCSSSL